MRIQTLPVSSKLVEEIPDALKAKRPPGWRLSQHQVETYRALTATAGPEVIFSSRFHLVPRSAWNASPDAPRPHRNHHMARTRYKIIDNNTPYFLTITVVNWIPLLSSPIAQQILLDALRFLQEQERLVLYAYVILENHLHLVAASVNLSKEIGDFKSYTARQLIDYYERVQAHNILKQLAFHKKLYKHDRDYQLWQEGSHPQRVQDMTMMRQKIEYIHQNPVQRGWVDAPTDWRLSSARNYAGKEGILEVQTQW